MATATSLLPRHPKSQTRRPVARSGLVFLIGLTFAAGVLTELGTARADDSDVQRTQDGPAYPVSQFIVQYAKDHPEHPPLAGLLPVDVLLGVSGARYTAPRKGLASETVSIDRFPESSRDYHASGLASVCQQIVAALQEHGLIGLYVAPHPADIDPATEVDLRRAGDSVLRVVVHTGQLRRIRTISLNQSAKAGSQIDNQIHRRIRLLSPLQPAEDARDDTSDLLQREPLEEYLHYLNRHPGRYVEAALAPGPKGGGVDLDFRINEAKPWQVYIQSSNTGTSQTAKWQNRIGFVHRQFTNRDDILSLDYMNAGVDKVHSLSLSYEAPWFAARRPAWWKKSGNEPSWLRWLNRDRLPWWGANRLRWQIAGNWTQYQATRLQGPTATNPSNGFSFDGSDWGVRGSLLYNFFQRGNLFADLVVGLGVRGLEAVSQDSLNSSSPILLLPSLALRLERRQELSSLFAEVGVEANVLPIDDVQNLGRGGAAQTWQLLTWNAVASHYLEPLLYPRAWRDTKTPATSTLGHELYLSTRGQYAFGRRLPPQATQVIGGLYSVRGYPQSTSTGDNVYLATLEYRVHLPNLLPIRRKPLELPHLGPFRWTRQQPYGRADWDLMIRLFADVAYTRQSASTSELAILEFNQLLAGAGVGVEFSIKSYLRVRVDYAWALRDSKDTIEPVRAGHNEIYFQFSLFY